MSYTVKSSEKLRKSGAETETKALLYLMNFRSDSDDIYYFVVDFFNDLTGMNNMATRLWDVQSKGNHNVGPKAIVIQSMMYALGNEPTFPTSFEYQKYYYYVEFEEHGQNYQICRSGKVLS